ncbi:MAG: hypothetical protein GX181_10050 [Synergistaceae bacterium]|nr:hypothetical protein [Synergistaceae bacterium]
MRTLFKPRDRASTKATKGGLVNNPFVLPTIITALKLVAAFVIIASNVKLFGGGCDSNHYHACALSRTDRAYNHWSILLRKLNSMGLYNRLGITIFLIIAASIIIPYLVARLSAVRDSSKPEKAFWMAFTATAAYPTLFFMSLDIYRDVPMVLLFCLALLCIKRINNGDNRASVIQKTKFSALFFALVGMLYLLRPYLGLALLAAYFISPFFSFSKQPLALWIAVFLVVVLPLGHQFGIFERLLRYRALFRDGAQGGANLGIVFSDDAWLFPIIFVKSLLMQLPGFFFPNKASVILFILEGIPFLWGVVYLVKNRRFTDKFVDFMAVFFVIYNTVWIIGNDNLGTAARLRIFGYIAVLISCVIVYRKHELSTYHGSE